MDLGRSKCTANCMDPGSMDRYNEIKVEFQVVISIDSKKAFKCDAKFQFIIHVHCTVLVYSKSFHMSTIPHLWGQFCSHRSQFGSEIYQISVKNGENYFTVESGSKCTWFVLQKSWNRRL